MRISTVHHPHHQIGFAQDSPRPLDAFGLQSFGVAQPRGVDQLDRPAIERNMHANRIAGGARDFGHDCPLIPRQSVDERTLADVRRTRDDDLPRLDEMPPDVRVARQFAEQWSGRVWIGDEQFEDMTNSVGECAVDLIEKDRRSTKGWGTLKKRENRLLRSRFSFDAPPRDELLHDPPHHPPPAVAVNFHGLTLTPRERRRFFTSPLVGEVGGASPPGGGFASTVPCAIPPTRLLRGDLPHKGGGKNGVRFPGARNSGWVRGLRPSDRQNHLVPNSIAERAEPEAVQLGRFGKRLAGGSEELSRELPRSRAGHLDRRDGPGAGRCKTPRRASRQRLRGDADAFEGQSRLDKESARHRP